MVAAKPERELAAKSPDELGVRLFKPPPPGFDPPNADARELRAYGYPARPDAERYPRAAERWLEMVSKPLSMIRPEFAVVKGRRSRLQVPIKDVPLQPGVNLMSPNWSGAIGVGT